jgi:hypothetical protein
MKITKHKSQELYTCRVNNTSFTSPDYSSVMKWRDDKIVNADYYNELQVLHDKAMQYMYDNNPTNYTGD